MKLPDPIKKVVDELAELPSIGPRQAIRLAFYLIDRDKDHIHVLAQSIDALRNVKICARCFFIHQNQETLCDICSNAARNHRVVMVVEKETDLISLENTGKFTGRYLVVGNIPRTGILQPWQHARIQALKDFVEKELDGQADEIILGFNPTTLGDMQAGLIIKELAPLTHRMSRLGRGLPTGGEIEFADDETLGAALDRRS